MEQKRKIKIVFNPNSDVIASGYDENLGNYTIKNDSSDNTILQQLLRLGNLQSKISFINDVEAPFFVQRLYNDRNSY